jgi:flagellar biosynthesis chaperone FliJ
MPAFHFRLQVLLDRRLEEQKQAEEALTQRQKELVVERQTLKDLEEEVTRISALYERRRSERLVVHSRGFRVSNQTDFLSALKLDIQAAQSSVLSQQLFVEQAQQAVAEAQEKLAVCRREVDVLDKYRDKAKKRFELDAAYQEELEQDEIGNVMYFGRQRKQ